MNISRSVSAVSKNAVLKVFPIALDHGLLDVTLPEGMQAGRSLGIGCRSGKARLWEVRSGHFWALPLTCLACAMLEAHPTVAAGDREAWPLPFPGDFRCGFSRRREARGELARRLRLPLQLPGRR